MRLLLLPLAVACTGNAPTYQGLKMSDYFPTDGQRDAEYVNDDPDTVPFTLEVQKVEPTETVGTTEVVTFEWYNEDTGELMGAVKWGSSSQDSIQIFAYAVGTDDYTTFDTPVQLTDDSNYMNRGESVVTETNGFTFTSTFSDVQDCPTVWDASWSDCVHITLDDGDGDDMAGPIFVGEYWLVHRYGPAWMKLTGYADNWNLAHYDWEVDG
jgi:hypothetical protein